MFAIVRAWLPERPPEREPELGAPGGVAAGCGG